MKLFFNRINSGVFWTLGSFGVLAISGIIINIIISGLKDTKHLGIFNLSYAVYIISSQLAVFGIHYSVLRYTAFFEKDLEIKSNILFSAILLSLIFGLVFSVMIYFSSPFLANLFNSPSSEKVIQHAAYGLFLFPLNKVLISYINGMRRMRVFSILQAGRYIIVMLWVVLICTTNISFDKISIGFFIAEFIIAIFSLAYLTKYKLFKKVKIKKHWIKTHLNYGGKILLAGILVELNTRVDVFLIAIFLSDYEVGIYSFASMLIEGLYNIFGAVRTNLNPILVGYIRDQKWDALKALLRKVKKYIYPITILLSGCILGGFWIISHYIIPRKGLEEGIILLSILLFCMTLISAYVPFDNLMLVSGFPSFQTLQHLVVIIFNIIFNIILVPILNLEGAAIAAGLSYIVGIIALIILTNKKLNWNLLTNSTARNLHQFSNI